MSDGCRCPCARHLSMSKSLRATTAELDDLRVPLLGCTDQIVRAESAVGCCPSPGSSVLAGDLVLPPALVHSEGLIVLPGSRLARPAGSRREPPEVPDGHHDLIRCPGPGDTGVQQHRKAGVSRVEDGRHSGA